MKKTQLTRCRAEDGFYWRVTETVLLHGVQVPAGFTTDGASVPKAFWWLLHPAGEAFEAAIVHDYRHLQKGLRSRRLVDLEFYDNMRICGVGKFRATLAWLAVRAYAKWHRLDIVGT